MSSGDEWFKKCEELEEKLKLHEEALVWAVGYLPPTCPGHFMHLLIEAKEKSDKLNGV